MTAPRSLVATDDATLMHGITPGKLNATLVEKAFREVLGFQGVSIDYDPDDIALRFQMDDIATLKEIDPHLGVDTENGTCHFTAKSLAKFMNKAGAYFDKKFPVSVSKDKTCMHGLSVLNANYGTHLANEPIAQRA